MLGLAERTDVIWGVWYQGNMSEVPASFLVHGCWGHQTPDGEANWAVARKTASPI